MFEQCSIVSVPRQTVKVLHQKGQSPLRPPSRRHTVSTMTSPSSKIILDFAKVSPTYLLADWSNDAIALGSFTPTESASVSLQSFAACKSLKVLPITVNHRRQRRPSLPTWPIYFDILSLTSPSTSTPNSPLSIDTTASSVPSITRTSSSYFVPDTPSPTGSTISEEEATANELNPIFASVERSSKFCTQVQFCAICKKPGKDYPRCRKCGEMWCSRECRLHDGAKRHLCASKDP